MEAGPDLVQSLSEVPFFSYFEGVIGVGITSASSLACSITCTEWPDVAQEIAAAIPLSPAPTMVMFRHASSGIWQWLVKYHLSG